MSKAVQVVVRLAEGIVGEWRQTATELISANEMLQNLPAILSEYGKTIGKDADKLTRLERQQAVMNWTLRRYDQG